MGASAFVFPGQGSQAVGMMAELGQSFPVVGKTFAEASSVLSCDLWDVCQQGPAERLNRTEVTQPAMLAAGVAAWRAWRSAGGGMPDWMAGHSLGEYSALVAAGVLRFADAVSLVAERARLMQQATPEGVGAMAAILGMDGERLAEICAEQGGSEVVSCANLNAPGQVVIAGHGTAVRRVCEAAKAAGAKRALVLPVSVPSHCPLMRPAAEQFTSTLASVHFAGPRVPVVQNADVAVHSGAQAVRDALARQLWQPVRWAETVRFFLANGVDTVVECGPGKVLAGLARRTGPELNILALTDGQAMAAALETGIGNE